MLNSKSHILYSHESIQVIHQILWHIIILLQLLHRIHQNLKATSVVGGDDWISTTTYQNLDCPKVRHLTFNFMNFSNKHDNLFKSSNYHTLFHQKFFCLLVISYHIQRHMIILFYTNDNIIIQMGVPFQTAQKEKLEKKIIRFCYSYLLIYSILGKFIIFLIHF